MALLAGSPSLLADVAPELRSRQMCEPLKVPSETGDGQEDHHLRCCQPPQLLCLSEFRLIDEDEGDQSDLHVCKRPAASSAASTASDGSTSHRAKADIDDESESDVISSSTGDSPTEQLQDDNTTREMSVATLVVLVIVFGCACQAPYEMMNTRDKGCGPLISLVDHLFGMLASMSALWKVRRVPWTAHLSLAAANMGYTFLLNQALSSELPTVVLVSMKNGNLCANMLLGVFILRSRYSLAQYMSVFCISAGLAFISVSAGAAPSRSASPGLSATAGLLSLLGALVSRAATGLLQEHLCKGYDAPVQELLFFRCLLGFPMVLLQWSSIFDHAQRWNAPEDSGIQGTSLWLLLLANIIFDYGTKVFVSWLIDRAGALTATLVLTVQRFISFVVSATLFGMQGAGCGVWIGSLAVLGGTVAYLKAAEASVRSKKD